MLCESRAPRQTFDVLTGNMNSKRFYFIDVFIHLETF